MDYEFDSRKSAQTLKERGFDFDFAARIFDGSYVEWEDTRRDYGEPRFIVLGPIQEDFFVVVYTWRNRRRRIISARRASQKEKDVYERATAQ